MMERLIWSESIVEEALVIRDRVEADLQRVEVVGELVVTGPASMVGVLTKGDLDLHLRVPVGEFHSVVERLRDIYRPSALSAWGPSLAVFDIPATRPTGVAATPVGSEHDHRFTRVWRRLRAEPGLLARYNALKLDYFGTELYEERKSAFFTTVADP